MIDCISIWRQWLGKRWAIPQGRKKDEDNFLKRKRNQKRDLLHYACGTALANSVLWYAFFPMNMSHLLHSGWTMNATSHASLTFDSFRKIQGFFVPSNWFILRTTIIQWNAIWSNASSIEKRWPDTTETPHLSCTCSTCNLAIWGSFRCSKRNTTHTASFGQH